MSTLKTPVVNALAFHIAKGYRNDPIPTVDDLIKYIPQVSDIAEFNGLEDLNQNLVPHLVEAVKLAAQLKSTQPINLGSYEVSEGSNEVALPSGFSIPEGFEYFSNTVDIKMGENKEVLKVIVSDRLVDGEFKGEIFVESGEGKIVPAIIEFKEKTFTKGTPKTNGEHVHNGVCSHQHDSDDSPEPKNSKSGSKALIAGLAGAVVGLLGYVTSEQKAKAVLAGVGAFGLVGAITSAVKRAGVEGEKAKGWLEGKGAWIVGLVSVLIGGIPYYLSDDKFKGSLMPIGLGVIGGVLAWFTEPARALFGSPTKK